MDKFEASNGVRITLTNAGKTGYCVIEPVDHPASASGYLSFEEMVAWREFFRAERDEDLGRWRWPENPDYVVYPLGLDLDSRRYACALHEPTGITGRWQEGQYRTVPPTEADDLGILAVAAYFDAHPARKPWHDAKPGEIWEIGRDGIGCGVYLRAHHEWRAVWPFSGSASPASSLDRVTSARRIYPPKES